MLEYKIFEHLPGLRNDEPARKHLFEQDGHLSTFAAKIEMAYALGIIDKDYKIKIDVVREIRNACAHTRRPLSLKTPVLKAACEAVIREMLPAIKDHEPATIRMAFLSKCAFIAHYIDTGEKIERPDDQIRHYEKLKAEAKRRD
jgi:hypothetical protein